ncbi:MAG: murein biosynthesis integral membrane protein MurJ [Thiotrichales bacterium]
MSRKLLKSTAVVSGMTMISRILGYLRDMVIAIGFGATGATDAFFVAFRIPNLLRRMFAEGAFAQAFVPVISEYKENRTAADVQDLVDHVTGWLAVVMIVITSVGILAAPWLIWVFAPGFASAPDQQALTVDMLRLTFPYVLFISLTALAGGILNSYGRFAVPAFTPTLLNLALIAAALWLAPRLEDPVVALAWGVFGAGVLQLAFQFPALIRLGLLPRPRLKRAHAGVKRIMTLMLPALFGSSVAQINLLINTVIASFLVAGSISWLYYTDRFVELPMAIFGVALSTVILPKLSSEHARQDKRAFTETLDWGLRLAMVVSLPAMLGLMLLARPIFATLLQYDQFTAHDSHMASLSLAVYALGLPFFVLIKILAPGFFSRQDTRTPVKTGIISVGVNLVYCAIIVVPWVLLDLPAPHAVLASATVCAAAVNAGQLFHRLRRDGSYVPQFGWARLTLQVTLALLVMGLALWWLTPALTVWEQWHAGQRALRLATLIGVGAIAYLLTLRLAGVNFRALAKAH